MERIMDIASKYNIKVIEDATEALGTYKTKGRYQGMHAGTIGDIGVYSFNANKIITTGGGGMVVSRHHHDMLEHIKYISLTAKNDSLYFVHDEVGFNYRMLNIQAALGVSQIDELEAFVEAKTKNYRTYAEQIKDVPGIKLLPFKDDIRPNYWFYSFVINEEVFGISRDQLMLRLIEEGIHCRPVWKLNHTQKAYLKYKSFEIEKAVYYEKNILNLPCSTNLKTEDIIYICDKIKKIRS
jgi:dTDP-4-amino-4,6-dideoxygalactose transaminase